MFNLGTVVLMMEAIDRSKGLSALMSNGSPTEAFVFKSENG